LVALTSANDLVPLPDVDVGFMRSTLRAGLPLTLHRLPNLDHDIGTILRSSAANRCKRILAAPPPKKSRHNVVALKNAPARLTR
jgi:hypothetical protein